MDNLPKRSSLEAVLAYKNIEIVNGFVKHYAVSQDEAEDLFEQVKRMLWLCKEMAHENPDGKGIPFRLDEATRILDEMWHNFVLFSQEYHDFCFENFGEFLHHKPTVEGGEYLQKRAALAPEEQAAKHLDEMRTQYSYVYAKLGKECFIKWYVTYKEKYSPENIMKLKLKAYEQRHGKIFWPGEVAMPRTNLKVVAG